LHPNPRAEQSRHRQYFVILHGQTPTGALQVHLERMFEPFQHVAGLNPISALRVPVRHLDDNERSAMQWAKRLKRVFQIDGEKPADRWAEEAVDVAAAQSGCQQAFRSLYERHAGYLMPILWRISGGDDGRAQDWLQESFLKAWTRLDALEDPGRFGAWIKRLAINHAISDRRRPALAVSDATLDLQAAPQPPWPAADRDLERAIAALPARARLVLVLFCLEGFTHAEIGRMLSIDDGTSKGQLHRARQLLKEALS